ncbi:hypothetical protein GCM10010435_05620 [Winogradskya consettensis]|uniref:SapB/AmfS family lantipeptide n=1 Tax=Winogradskya consettensis TaxID=113560 RepID=A0A919SXI5_9ACTN|nr:SapB/AmfS family lanthipeptide [Actinoplanes consettensis]GIM79489.1 hypothetical protein Aco04nite_65750 [Actinoplanes consettensis]
MESILELQELTAEDETSGVADDGADGIGDSGSRASLLLCGDSSLSIATCN